MIRPTLQDVVFWVVCGFVAVMIAVKFWPWLRRFVSTGDAIGTLPAFAAEMRRFKDEMTAAVDAVGEKVDGLGEQVVAVVDQVEVVRKQVENSHVTNLRDDVDEIKNGVTRLENHQAGQSALIAAVIERENETDRAIARIHARFDK